MAGEDLFSGAAADRLASRAPLAARMRPHTLDEIIGQQHLIGPGAPLRALIEADRLTSAILWGPPGTGKTTLASVVATATAKHFVPLSAVTAGVKDVREVVEGARRLLGEQGRGTILFLDEVHRFNRSQQDALLPSVEEGLLVLIGATTENPFFQVNAPLLSRSPLWRQEPLSDEELAEVVARGLAAEGASADADAVAALVGLADGDARAVLTTLEVALALAGDEVPWLRGVKVKPDGTLSKLEDLPARPDPDALLEGRVVLLAQLLGLLVAFIGEDLTLRLVREIWPREPLNDLDLVNGTKRKNEKAN